MTLAAGTVEYTLGSAPITGCGLSYTASELESALAGPVAEIVFDGEGATDLTNMLSSLPSTEFDPECVKRILENNREPEAWRVGEAFGESYLAHHRTRTSHGEKEFNDGLMAERRKQIGLASKEQMLDLIECPLSADDLQQILIEGGRIREPEPKVKD